MRLLPLVPQYYIQLSCRANLIVILTLTPRFVDLTLEREPRLGTMAGLAGHPPAHRHAAQSHAACSDCNPFLVVLKNVVWE